MTWMRQPLTAGQLARQMRMGLDGCSQALLQLSSREVVFCLTPESRRSRLYWLTPLGVACQEQIRKLQSLPLLVHAFSDIDWKLYGSLCFSHRSAIIKALSEPLQPAAIKRKARSHNPNIKMSANNVRDAIKPFVKNGVLQQIKVKRKVHPRYELTELGKRFQRLLRDADTPV